MFITSSENKKIKDLKKLNDRKYRDAEGLFLVEGEHLVIEAFKSGLLVELILEENARIGINMEAIFATSNVMKELSSLTTPATVIGVCQKRGKTNNLGNRIILLDSIQDPGNLGTIIRSAVAFNVDTIVIGNGTVDVYNPKVLRATQGLIFHINIIEENLLDVIPRLKENDYKIIGTDITNGMELKSFTSPDKFALIMGNEGHGTNIKIKNLCDDFVYIDMNVACESLNVSIACSIILYQLDKR